MPCRPISNSVSAPRGQPPPGSSASSAAKPVGSASSAVCARWLPRQMPGCCSTDSSEGVTGSNLQANPFHSGKTSQAPAVTDHPDGDAFDHQLLAHEVDLDRLEIRVFRKQLHGIAALFEA